MSSNSRRVRSALTPPREGLELVGADLAPRRRRRARRRRGASARLRRRTTASTRAMSSSGWHGFVTQSSAPIRRPRTRWATDERPVQTTTPRPGRQPAQPLEVRPALRPEDREVDDERVEPHRDDGVERDGARQHAVLPAGALQPLAEDLQESGVGVQDGQADRRLRRMAAPLERLDGVCRCHLGPEHRRRSRSMPGLPVTAVTAWSHAVHESLHVPDNPVSGARRR